jgi:hypothetical protein
MMKLSGRTLAVLSLTLLSACARHKVLVPDAMTPPRPQSESRPALVGATADNPVAVEALVDIDANGRADLSTLKVTGPGADGNREIIANWLRDAVFEPARKNGVPVRGQFRMSAEARVTVDRLGTPR